MVVVLKRPLPPYAAHLHANPDRPDSPRVATEICGTSISSQGPSATMLAGIVAANPHIVFADSEARGYVVVDIGREGASARLRAVETVKRADAPIATRYSGVIEAGRAGIERQ